jgi:hypothetical protein
MKYDSTITSQYNFQTYEDCVNFMNRKFGSIIEKWATCSDLKDIKVTTDEPGKKVVKLLNRLALSDRWVDVTVTYEVREFQE